MPPSTGSRLRATGMLLMGGLGRGGAQGIAALLVASRLGAHEWGLVATIQVSVLLVVQLTSSGLYVAQLGSSGRASSRLAQPPTAAEIRAFAGLTAVLATPVLVIILDLSVAETILTVCLAVVMAVASSVEQITRAHLIQRDAISTVAALNIARSVVVLGSAIVFLVVGAPGGASGWIVALLASWAIHLAVLGVIRRRLQLPAISRRTSGRVANMAKMLGFGVGIVATDALRTSDQLILAGMSTLGEVGTYALAARMIDIGVIAVASHAQVSHRMLSSQETGAALSKATFKVARGLAYLAVPAGLLVIVGSVVISTRLDASFDQLVPIAALLAMSLVPRGMYLAFAFTLMLAGRTMERNLAVFGALALNAVLNVWLIPIWGAIGSSIATVIAESLLAVSLGIMVARPHVLAEEST